MLVDAVCALAARFSPHPILGPPQALPIDSSQPAADIKLWDRGLPFAHRAMSALVDSLSCPTLSAVQACLLLAYEQFGSNHDSGLWMYLGISIRMAQDLGLQKHQGLKHNYGQKGVTPKEVMTGQAGKLREDQYDDLDVYQSPKGRPPAQGTERARERERVDSFWSIFFLDRVISSGTGRPVTLRDEDIELRFPLQSESQLPNGWPAPFPPLIRIIHLYGRVTDLINGIQDVNHVTSDTLKRLAGMESDLTGMRCLARVFRLKLMIFAQVSTKGCRRSSISMRPISKHTSKPRRGLLLSCSTLYVYHFAGFLECFLTGSSGFTPSLSYFTSRLCCTHLVERYSISIPTAANFPCPRPKLLRTFYRSQSWLMARVSSATPSPVSPCTLPHVPF